MSIEKDSTRYCYLLPVLSTGKEIFLPDGIDITIGRSSKFGIYQSNCSKNQISAVANYERECVSVKTIGRNPSFHSGKPMKQDKTYNLKNDEIIDLVPEAVVYKVSFTSQRPSASYEQTYKETPVTEKQLSFEWQLCGNGELLMCLTSGFKETKTKAACFDLDNTLIKTKSGSVFPKDNNDWTIWNGCIKQILKDLDKNDYKIVIFTNQAGLGMPGGKAKIHGFKQKIEDIIETLDVPIQVFVATTNGLYRKPSPGMWFFMVSRGVPVDVQESFYVGDAAGRPANWKAGKKADFSISDRLFAINLGIKFYTPEEYFLKEPVANYNKIMFHPWQCEDDELPKLDLPSKTQEVILMVGSPGSGKSHFVKHYIAPHNYKIISRDQLSSWQKCVAALQTVLQSKNSAVIDNTHPDRSSRQRFIEICKKHNLIVRCFLMNTSLERCIHNNIFREIIDDEHQIVGSSIIKKFHANFEPPNIEEGFSDIVKIPFRPHFENSEQKYFYNCYLISK